MEAANLKMYLLRLEYIDSTFFGGTSKFKLDIGKNRICIGAGSKFKLATIAAVHSWTNPTREDRWHDHLLEAGTAIVRTDNGRVAEGVGIPFISGSTDREVVIIDCDGCPCSTNFTSRIMKYISRKNFCNTIIIPNSPVKHVRSSEKQVPVD